MNAAPFVRVFEVVGPVILIALIGYFFARKKPLDMRVANEINTDCLLPALIFVSLVNMKPTLAELLKFGGFSAFIVLGSGVLGLAMSRGLGLSLKTIVPPVMFKNYGNLGLPLAFFAFGEGGLGLMAILAVAGNCLHLSVGFWILQGKLDGRMFLREPMIVAAAAGIAVSLLEAPLPAFLMRGLELLGNASIPLMLFALGVRMVGFPHKETGRALLGAVACPAFGLACFFVLDALFALEGLERNVLLVFSVLPPAILNFMFAERFNVEPSVVAAIVLVGTLFALVSIPAALIFAV